jgi:hypothetical protein
LCDHAVETFLAEDGVAEASAAAAEEVHEVAWSSATAGAGEEYVWSAFGSTAAADEGYASLPVANVHHYLPKYLGDVIRLLLVRLRLVCVARC